MTARWRDFGLVTGASLLAGLAVLALVPAGCGTVTGPGATVQPPVTQCTIYAYQNDARVTVTAPDAHATCAQFISAFSSGGGPFWDYAWTAPQEGGFGVVCTMTSGSVTATVRDDGGQMIGQEVCSDLASSGWTES
jgi:hypothetical protein